MMYLNELGEKIITEISFQFLRIWDPNAGITREEVKISKYNNIYPDKFASSYGIEKALESASERSTKTQDKLTTLTQLQGGVLAIASIFITGKSGISFALILIGIFLTLLGMIIVLNALKVTVSIVPSFEKLRNGKSKYDKAELIEYLIDSNRRSDFQADSNKAATSLIIAAMILFVASIVFDKIDISKIKNAAFDAVNEASSLLVVNQLVPTTAVPSNTIIKFDTIPTFVCKDTITKYNKNLFNLTMPIHRDLPVVHTDPSAR